MNERILLAALVILWSASNTLVAELRVGATITDVTPIELPVLVNGGMTTRTVGEVNTRVNARTLVIDDGEERIGISVVDSCMMPRPLLDDVKALTAMQTGLKPDRILISATHTHSAPSSMGALGTDADERYVAFLREKLVQSFVEAEQNLAPALVGWGLGHAPEYTALRRWVRRPDRVAEDPFGNPTVRANMHAARNLDDVTGESGPEDPDLSLISFQSPDGRPIAVLANFSMHYFSDKALSADYFGLFCQGMQDRLAPEADDSHPPFVALMSHGCSGDIWRRDYTTWTPEQDKDLNIAGYAAGLLDIALEAYETIEYQQDVDIEMAETRLQLDYRVPDAQRLQWAQQVVAEMGDRPPKTTPEVYAREQIILHQLQSTEIVVQGLRIGDIGIATTPNETYALTGLKVKLNSPLQHTMVIELANGGDGYIPPPEQHHLGGYNTWAARSAGLEVQAEPKIAATGLALLEQVSGQPARDYEPYTGPATQKILDLAPFAYWRMDEMAGPLAADSSGFGHLGTYEIGVCYFLEGPHSDRFSKADDLNRCPHFAGGRMLTRLEALGETFSVSMWIWNGMPVDGRPVTGWMFSRGRHDTPANDGLHLGLGGVENHPGRLLLGQDGAVTAGTSRIDRWTWNHVVLTADGNVIRVYLNGQLELEAEQQPIPTTLVDLFVGGRSDEDSTWEGRLDEVAIFERPLTVDEMRQLSGN